MCEKSKKNKRLSVYDDAHYKYFFDCPAERHAFLVIKTHQNMRKKKEVAVWGN
jgi:hypothetical protein